MIYVGENLRVWLVIAVIAFVGWFISLLEEKSFTFNALLTVIVFLVFYKILSNSMIIW